MFLSSHLKPCPMPNAALRREQVGIQLALELFINGVGPGPQRVNVSLAKQRIVAVRVMSRISASWRPSARSESTSAGSFVGVAGDLFARIP